MSMHRGTGLFLLVALLSVFGCASSRPAASGGSSTSYNDYNEDLFSARPVYSPSIEPVATGTAPTRPNTTPPAIGTTPARRPDTRRPNAPVEAMHVNRRLDMVLDTIAQQNRSIRYAPGYRVQVYVGNRRQEADDAKLLIYQNFPELSPYLTYNQPTYRLKVGDFMRRIDAERYFASIRRLISSAQLQPDKVDIRRSLLIR